MTRKLAAYTLVALLVVCSAQAQDDGPDPREQARTLLARGNDAFGRHDYTAALEAFREAFALAPLPQIRFNIARCLERLARFREAAAEYRAAAASERLGADERQRARSEEALMRERLATLAVSAPAGVSLRIDDDVSCVVPCELELDPGERRIEGPNGGARAITLTRGERTEIAWELAEPPPALAVPTPSRHEPGALAIAGGIVAAAGLGGILGFGLRVEALLGQFDAMPSHAIADEGEIMAGLANASIGVAAVGGVLVLIDLLLALP